MKYICTEDKDNKEEIFLFPNGIDHDCMAEMLGFIKNQSYGDWERVFRLPISAGFVDKNNKCFGESVTLKLKSRGKVDTDLLKKEFLTSP